MRVFSGIQPTGGKHLGNYLGAVTGYVEGQDRGEAIYCIVDLDAITVPYEPQVLATNVLDTAALLIAAGIDPNRCLLFRQSDVNEHTELSWLLTAVTAYGELAGCTSSRRSRLSTATSSPSGCSCTRTPGRGHPGVRDGRSAGRG